VLLSQCVAVATQPAARGSRRTPRVSPRTASPRRFGARRVRGAAPRSPTRRQRSPSTSDLAVARSPVGAQRSCRLFRSSAERLGRLLGGNVEVDHRRSDRAPPRHQGVRACGRQDGTLVSASRGSRRRSPPFRAVEINCEIRGNTIPRLQCTCFLTTSATRSEAGRSRVPIGVRCGTGRRRVGVTDDLGLARSDSNALVVPMGSVLANPCSASRRVWVDVLGA
jgi:hypothetical protein